MTARARVSRILRALLPVFVAVGLSVIGCGGAGPLPMQPAPRAFTPLDYDSVYERWTRDADDFSFGRLENVLTASATFESWEFRWAYVVRYANDFSLDTDVRTQMMRATLEDAEENHRFFVSIIGRKWREADLASTTSAWRVVLVDPTGNPTVPVSIERIENPSAAVQTYFRRATIFRRSFRLVFPIRRSDGSATIPPDSTYVILRFTGALGTVDLRWDLVPLDPIEGDAPGAAATPPAPL